jgi:hypothetical protein
MAKISKTAQVLKYFAQQYGRPGIPRTRLGKFAYMADVISRQYLGHPITDFKYRKDHYGPYARELPEYTAELVAADLVDEISHRGSGEGAIRLHDLGRPIPFDFTAGEAEVLAYVMAHYEHMDFDEFVLAVVKETDPFKAVHKQGDVLPMHQLDGVVRSAVGFDLESIIRAEKQAEAGEYDTLDQFADALRSAATA